MNKTTTTNNENTIEKVNNKQINNPIHYFNKVVNNMNIKDYKKQKKINSTEYSVEFSEYDEQLLHQHHSHNNDIVDHIHKNDNLSWIELIENEQLYLAMKTLKIEDVSLIHMWLNQGYTQKEIAEHMGMQEKTVNKRLSRIRKGLRIELENK